MATKSKWEKVGKCGVDAGFIIIGDPCYFATPDRTEHPAATWSEFHDLIKDCDSAQQLNYKKGHAGLGVVISGFGGDGMYPVSIKKDGSGRVISAKIDFV